MAEAMRHNQMIVRSPAAAHPPLPDAEWPDGGEEYPVLAFIRERHAQLAAENRNLVERLETLSAEAQRLRQEVRDERQARLTNEAEGARLQALDAQLSATDDDLTEVQHKLSQQKELRRRLADELSSAKSQLATVEAELAKRAHRRPSLHRKRPTPRLSLGLLGRRKRLDMGMMSPAAAAFLAATVFLAFVLVGWGRYGQGDSVDPLWLGIPDKGNNLPAPARVEAWKVDPVETAIQKVRRVVEHSVLGPRANPTAPADSWMSSTTKPQPSEQRFAGQQEVTSGPQAARRGSAKPEAKDDPSVNKDKEEAPLDAENGEGAPYKESGPSKAGAKKNPEADVRKNPEPDAKESPEDGAQKSPKPNAEEKDQNKGAQKSSKPNAEEKDKNKGGAAKGGE